MSVSGSTSTHTFCSRSSTGKDTFPHHHYFASTVENETPFTLYTNKQDWMAENLLITGSVGDQTDNQGGLFSTLQSLDPPVLKRLVASSWGERDRNGAVATAWADITTQNPFSGPSIYHEHYSSEEEDLAGELGKVTTIASATSSMSDSWDTASAAPSSFATSETQALRGKYIATHSTLATSGFGDAAYLHSTTTSHAFARSSRDGMNPLFATIKDCPHEHKDEYVLESVQDMTLQDEDFGDEMELEQVNSNATIEFGIKDDCRMKFTSVTPSPDVLRMQRSPFKTPARESDMMTLSPPSIHKKHAFRTVFLPSPNRHRSTQQHRDIPVKAVPIRFKANTTSTFAYPRPIVLSEKLGCTSRADLTSSPRLERQVQQASQFLPRMPTAEGRNDHQADDSLNHAKDAFTLHPRGGNFKVRASKRKGSPVEYTFDFAGVPATAQSLPDAAEPYQELCRTISPMLDHPLFAPISSGRHQPSALALKAGGEHHCSPFPHFFNEPLVSAKNKSHKTALPKKKL